MNFFDNFTLFQKATNVDPIVEEKNNGSWGLFNNRILNVAYVTCLIDRGKCKTNVTNNESPFINIFYTTDQENHVDLSNKTIVIDLEKIVDVDFVTMFLTSEIDGFILDDVIRLDNPGRRIIFDTAFFEVDITHIIELRLFFRLSENSELIINPLRSISNFIDRSINSNNSTSATTNNRPINQFINFGKYKNRTFRYVMKYDKQYCNWVISTSKEKNSSKEMKEFARYIQNN